MNRRPAESDLGVMTWNIRGARRPPLQEGVAGEILARRADIVGLQEIQRHQAEHLQRYLSASGDRWHMSWSQKGNWNWNGRSLPRREGHAILSRFEIAENGSAGSSWNLGDNRILQRVVLDSPHGRLHVYNTHLTPGRRLPLRLEQSGEIRRRIADDRAAEGAGFMAVLTGDMNDGPSSQTVSMLTSPLGAFSFRDAWGERFPSSLSKRKCPRGARSSECGWTSTTSAPVDRRDYVLVGSGLTLRDVTTPFAEVEQSDPGSHSRSFPFYERISDHFPVIAYLARSTD